MKEIPLINWKEWWIVALRKKKGPKLKITITTLTYISKCTMNQGHRNAKIFGNQIVHTTIENAIKVEVRKIPFTI